MSILKRIISIFLALFMFFAQSGLSMNAHFCFGISVEHSMSLGLENLDCGMGMLLNCPTEESGKAQVQRHSCCANYHATLDVEDHCSVDLENPSVGLTSIDLPVISVFNHFNSESVSFWSVSDPPDPQPITLELLQRFII